MIDLENVFHKLQYVWSQTNLISWDTQINSTQFGWNMPVSDDTLWKPIKKTY